MQNNNNGPSLHWSAEPGAQSRLDQIFSALFFAILIGFGNRAHRAISKMDHSWITGSGTKPIHNVQARWLAIPQPSCSFVALSHTGHIPAMPLQSQWEGPTSKNEEDERGPCGTVACVVAPSRWESKGQERCRLETCCTHLYLVSVRLLPIPVMTLSLQQTS